MPADDGMDENLGGAGLHRVTAHRQQLIQILIHDDETEVEFGRVLF